MNGFPYDAVVFDLDGTLFDAEEGILRAIRTTMEQIGVSIPPELNMRRLVGPPLRESFRDALGVPEERIDEAVERYARNFLSCGLQCYSVYPGVRGLLRTLKENGTRVALASSKPRSLCVKILRDFALLHYFDRVEGETDNQAKLGKAELIRRALPESFRRAAMVGDRRFDMEGAKAAGVDGVGAGYGCGSREELEQAGAAFVAKDTAALRELLCPGAPIPRGFFLTMEGLDGCGKTTQADALEASLKRLGFDVTRTREPGGCPIGEKIRQIILDTENAEMCGVCEALLYAASRAQHVHQVVRPGVEAGRVVLSDRFVDSSVAYQGGGRSLGVELVQRINAPAVEGMLPDATVYLAVDHTTALRRRLNASAPDRMELENGGFYRQVQEAYERLLRESPERFLTVQAEGDVKTIAAEVLKKVLARLEPEAEREA